MVMLRWTVVLLAVLVGACGPQVGPRAPRPEPTLTELCAAAEPAERPARLVEAVPAEVRIWLEGFIRPAAGAAEARARAESALASFRTLEDPTVSGSLGFAGIAAQYVQVLEAAYLLEQYWPDDAVLAPPELAPLLEPLYDALRLPAFFSSGFLQQLGGLAAQLLAQEGAPAAVLAAVMQLLRILPERSRVLHRHVALKLVCGGTDDATVAAQALGNLADSARDAGEFEECLALRRELVRRTPDDVTAHYALAQAAWRAGRTDDGRRAVEEADARCGADCPDRPEGLERYAEASARIAAADDAQTPDERLAVADALDTVGRTDEARTLFEDLLTALPDDARPATGLARLALQQSLDIATALPLLETAGPEHRTGQYWELLVTCRAMALFYVVLPQAMQDPSRVMEVLGRPLRSLREATVAYQAFNEPQALAVLLVVDAALRVADAPPDPSLDGGPSIRELRQALAAVADGSQELLARFPDAPELVSLSISSALFASSAERTFAALERPVATASAEDVELMLRRANLFLYGALNWDQRERLPGTDALLDQVPATGTGATDVAILRADLLAVRWRAGTGAGEAVRDAYRTLAEDETLDGARRARVLNNLGMVQAALGETGDAAQRFFRSEDLDAENSSFGRFNRMALAGLAAAPDAAALEALRVEMETHETDDSQGAVGRQALLWRAWLADRDGRADEAAALRARADEAGSDDVLSGAVRGDDGCAFRGKFQFGLGYDSRRGLVLELDTGASLWLLLTAPAPTSAPVEP
jgi:tetratricopeptide (TPR) repeat protein